MLWQPHQSWTGCCAPHHTEAVMADRQVGVPKISALAIKCGRRNIFAEQESLNIADMMMTGQTLIFS